MNAKTKSAAAGGEDQSMEEILQSIRKIIADESDDPADSSGENPPAAASSVAEEGEADEETSAPDSDVLELTDVVQDDGSVVNVHEASEGDVLDTIDNVLNKPDAEPVRAPEAVAPPPPQQKAAPPPPRPQPINTGDGLVSSASIAASAEAMRALRSPVNFGSMPFVSGETVEGLVMQLLRPMLKEWLDANLPMIVQQEVQREVRRITASLDGQN